MYRVKLTPTASQMFNSLHPLIKKQLKTALRGLYENPHLGKELHDKLINFRSLKMKRYRAIYQIDDQGKTIVILAIGHRRDIYEIVNELTVKH
ncbi:MAG: hypothetical protein GQ563_07920 [Desulfuromusa sp.]|nr:hypothetical protein [Desulfuromusa sp.]